MLAKVYTIKKMFEDEVVHDFIWKKVDKADIACYPWDQNGYMPHTEASAIYMKKAFIIYDFLREGDLGNTFKYE